MQRVPLAIKGLAIAAMSGTLLFAECLPTIGGSFNVNGIVVGKVIGTGGTPPGACLADAGWGGIAANTFVAVNPMMPDTHVSRMFFVAQAAGANVDRMYVGIHVENDDGFTSDDILTMYVDANNSGSFDAPDFALRIEMGPSTPPTNEQCNQTPSAVTLFRFSGGSWSPQAAATGIQVRTSFDYSAEMPDPESGIWEVEIEIRPGDFATPVTIPVATGLRIGAKLYVEEPGIGTRVLAFPAGLTADENPNATDPNDGGVTAAKLATLTVGTCGFDVKILSIKGTDAAGNAGKFTRFPGAVPSGAPQRNKFNAEVQFFNPANPADTSAIAVANVGTVNMRALPWGTAGPISEIPLQSPMPQAAFTALGQIQNVQVDWPDSEADYAPHRANLASVGHVCYKVHLSGFTTNLNEASDVMQTNLTFTSLSTVKESFLLQAPRQEGPGGVIRYLLRAKWNNVPRKLMSPRPRRGSWYFRLPNAGQIGLKPVRPGWYAIELKPGQDVRVDVELTGGDFPVTRRDVLVRPRAGGQAASKPSGDPPVPIPVKPGMMVTLVANGLVTLQPKGTPNGPDGFGIQRAGTDDVAIAAGKRPFLLNPKGAFDPTQNIGALIGSFDKFQTAFVVGGARSFMVPEKATHLYLAINDEVARFDDNEGRGFRVSVILTPPQFLPTRLASPGNTGNGLPALADVGANLPQFTVDVLMHDEQRRLIRPAGYVAYAITNSHRQ